jgi:signal transduction histidine kinase
VPASQSIEPWRRFYRTSRNEALVTNTVACAALIPPIVVGLTAYMLTVEPETKAVRFGLGGAYVLACLLILGLWRRGVLVRRAVPFALSFVIAIIAIAIVYWWFLPMTAGGATSTLLVIQWGTALLFPWGPVPQGAVCAALIAGYAWLVQQAPETFQAYSAGLLVATAPLIVFAAHLIDRYRGAAFEREWQKEQVVSLARELGTRVDRSALGTNVLAHGMRLLGADGGSVVLRTLERRTFRIDAIEPPDSPWLGYEIVDDFGLGEQVGRAGVLVLPRDDPASPLLPVLAQEGKRHALYAALREADDLIGVLGFVRTADSPFREADRSLARAVADQAALALRTASVIEDLRRANALKSEFVSTMSHELRTPLNVILGYVEMARDHTAVDRDQCLDRIEAAGRELLELIESTLEIGRLEAGNQEARIEPVALVGFWGVLGEASRRLPRRPDVTLEWGATVPALTVQTDPRKLNIVVRNLVGNALKFTERGYVRVDLLTESGRIGLRVADTGIGICAEDRESVFEMFRQADGSDARRYGGVGLGLYIVRRFVDQLGGTITLDSTPGVGSTFVVWLPCPASPGTLSAVA